MHKKIFLTLFFLTFSFYSVGAEDSGDFKIRGTLPWHNFLSGPSAWNFEDYKNYLDEMADLGLNFVVFHCYTGGSQRYVTYVEPHIRVEYKNILPNAEFDTSITARWGYRPLPTDKFFYNTNELFEHPIFGSDAAIEAKNNEERYQKAIRLMQRVFDYAHQKGIKVGLGFEFGVYPPEFYSILSPGAMMRIPYLPDPTHPENIALLKAYLDSILETYPQVDSIWLWLQELYNPTENYQFSQNFRKFYDDNIHHFDYIDESMKKFYGVWSLCYIQQAFDYVKENAPQVQVAISGWGGETQFPPLLKGLHESLPQEIVFTCLNPVQGWKPQAEIMGQLSGREAWIIPWLEGDLKLWHPQPRVSLLTEQIALAKQQEIEGVIGIHWRTEDIRMNFEALGQYTQQPFELDEERRLNESEKNDLTLAFYQTWCEKEYGEKAAELLAPVLSRFDVEQILAPSGGVNSPEYHAYEPHWGTLPEPVQEEIHSLLEVVDSLLEGEEDAKLRENLEYLRDTYQFVLLLDQVSRKLDPSYQLMLDVISGQATDASDFSERREECLKAFREAPIEQLFKTYARRIRSRGELGVLSAINQKLGLFVQDVEVFYRDNP